MACRAQRFERARHSSAVPAVQYSSHWPGRFLKLKLKLSTIEQNFKCDSSAALATLRCTLASCVSRLPWWTVHVQTARPGGALWGSGSGVQVAGVAVTFEEQEGEGNESCAAAGLDCQAPECVLHPPKYFLQVLASQVKNLHCSLAQTLGETPL